MTFKLPDLPYAYDALAPYMSAETLQFHHDKHHLAYVDNGNKLIVGSGFEGKSLEDICNGAFAAKNAGLVNNVGQHYNHLHFWQWMKKGGGGNKLPGKARQDGRQRPWRLRQDEGRLRPGRPHPVRLRLVLARHQGRQA